MNNTSHFIAIDTRLELFSELFSQLKKFLKINNIEDIIELQSINSLHITLYYLEKTISIEDRYRIKADVGKIDVTDHIYVDGFDYFYRDNERYVLYLDMNTNIDLEKYKNFFHDKYQRVDIEENMFDFKAHLTLGRIIDRVQFEKFRGEIEDLLTMELCKLKKIDINTGDIFLYMADSTKVPQKQTKVSL